MSMNAMNASAPAAGLHLEQLLPGFADPVHDAQQAFRCLLDAMSRPGSLQSLPFELSAPAGLKPAMSALLLALADRDTPLWLPPELRSGAAGEHLRFHAGCPLVAEMGEAQFLMLQGLNALPTLDALRLGDAAYPDRSATLFIEVPALATGSGPLRLRGPGIQGETRIEVAGWSASSQAFVQENRRRFPLGVDLVLCADRQLLALPRTTLIDWEL